MRKLVDRARGFVKRLREERGAQTIEWVALALVVMALASAVMTVIGKDQEIGNSVVRTLSKFIDNLSKGM